MPIVLTNKIYIHMPKTGGTWVAHAMRKDNGGIMLPHYGGHASVSELPDHIVKGKKLFGTKRDPWGWYASWYAHAVTNPAYHDGLKYYGSGSNASYGWRGTPAAVLHRSGAARQAKLAAMVARRNQAGQRRFVHRRAPTTASVHAPLLHCCCQNGSSGAPGPTCHARNRLIRKAFPWSRRADSNR